MEGLGDPQHHPGPHPMASLGPNVAGSHLRTKDRATPPLCLLPHRLPAPRTSRPHRDRGRVFPWNCGTGCGGRSSTNTSSGVPDSAGIRVRRVAELSAAHPTEHGGDRRFRWCEPDEFDPDAHAILHGGRGIPDLTFEPKVDRTADCGSIDRDTPAHQFPRLRMMERDAETQRRDVDDLTISPPRWRLSFDVTESSPRRGLARHSTAELHGDSSSPTPWRSQVGRPWRHGLLGGKRVLLRRLARQRDLEVRVLLTRCAVLGVGVARPSWLAVPGISRVGQRLVFHGCK